MPARKREAEALGLSEINKIPKVSENPAKEQTPGYSSTPSESSASSGGVAGLNSEASSRYYRCQNSQSADCQASNQAYDDGNARAKNPSVVSENDPNVVSARQIGEQPSSVIGSISGSYSDCRVDGIKEGEKWEDEQYCHNYYFRTLDNGCKKTLTVEVTWKCELGWSGPYGGPPPSCSRVVTECEGGGSLNSSNSECSGGKPGSSTTPVSSVIETQATPIVKDIWKNECAGMEGRVPPGKLLPDGDNSHPGEGATSGRLDKCERVVGSGSICLDKNSTKIINGLAVTRPCWLWSNSFNCVELSDKSDCNEPRFGSCTPKSSEPECIDRDPFDPQFCTAVRFPFSCITFDSTRTTPVANCAGRTFKDEKTAANWSSKYEPDKDFAVAMGYLEVNREAGTYLDQNNFRLFQGTKDSCDKKLFGLVNCCNKAGVGRSQFTDFVVSNGVYYGASMALSNYAFDPLFVGSNVSSFLTTFSQGFISTGMGWDIGLWLGQLNPYAFAISIAVQQLSQLIQCEVPEKLLAMKRDSDLCVFTDASCTKRLPVIRTCLVRTYRYCCFNSRLSRLINEQGGAQINKSMDCAGFSPEELQKIDFSKMDLSKFFDEVKLQPIQPVNPAESRKGGVADCYFGEGKCTPATK